MMNRYLLTVAKFLALGCTVACSAGSESVEPAKPGSPSSSKWAALPDQPVVAATIAISGTIVDSVGVGVPNQTVKFVVTKGGGSVAAPQTQTAPDGSISNQWILGVQADQEQELEVRWVHPVSGATRTLGALRVTAIAGPVDSLFNTVTIFGVTLTATSPARFPKNGVVDKYLNAVPYRIPADARLTPQGAVPGTEGAHIVTFTAAAADGQDHSLTLLGVGDTPVATLVYRVVVIAGNPTIIWMACGLKVTSCKLPST